MKILHQNHLWQIQLNEAENLFWIKWSPDTEHMQSDEFKNELTHYLALVQKHHPEKVLIDSSEFKFVILPAVQEWVDTKINSQVSLFGVKKIAFLTTPDIFSQVSIEQTVEEEHAVTMLDIQFFDDSQKASEWLNS